MYSVCMSGVDDINRKLKKSEETKDRISRHASAGVFDASIGLDSDVHSLTTFGCWGASGVVLQQTL